MRGRRRGAEPRTCAVVLPRVGVMAGSRYRARRCGQGGV